MECKIQARKNTVRIGELQRPRIVRLSGGWWLVPLNSDDGITSDHSCLIVLGLQSSQLMTIDCGSFVEDYGDADEFFIQRKDDV